jgi:hypothetical protein
MRRLAEMVKEYGRNSEVLGEWEYKDIYNEEGSKKVDSDDEFEKIYGDDLKYKERRTVLMNMAKSYREMFEAESKLYHERSLRLMHYNGFLLAALGLILASNKDFHPGFLICTTLLFVLLGCIFGQKHKQSIIAGLKADWYLCEKWKKFLIKFFDYPENINLTRDFYIPPIYGMSNYDDKFNDKEEDSWVKICPNDVYERNKFEPLISCCFRKMTNMHFGDIVTVFWILIFCLVACFSLCNSGISFSVGSHTNEVELKMNSTSEGFPGLKPELGKRPAETQSLSLASETDATQ